MENDYIIGIFGAFIILAVLIAAIGYLGLKAIEWLIKKLTDDE